jgi:hypothetical protein
VNRSSRKTFEAEAGSSRNSDNRTQSGEAIRPQAKDATKSSDQRFFDFFWPSSHYQLARIAILRLLGLVYCCAFSVALFQGPALIGKNGLYPAYSHLQSLKQLYGNNAASQVPSIFWHFDLEKSDFAIELCSCLGLAISLFILVTGSANMIMLAVLWVLQTSLHAIGQLFWGYML